MKLSVETIGGSREIALELSDEELKQLVLNFLKTQMTGVMHLTTDDLAVEVVAKEFKQTPSPAINFQLFAWVGAKP